MTNEIIQDSSTYEEINNEYFNEIVSSLRDYYPIFNVLWRFGKPSFSEKTKTSAVVFNKSGRPLSFVINKDFWNSIPYEKKLFVICHECLHVIYLHPLKMAKQMKNMLSKQKSENISKEFQKIQNAAADLVTNHKLISDFGFNRNNVDPGNIHIWIDTVFEGGVYVDTLNKYKAKAIDKSKPEYRVKYFQNYEYYFDILNISSQSDGKGNSFLSSQSTVDDHDTMSGSFEEGDSEESYENILSGMKDVFDYLDSELTDEEKQIFDKSFGKDIDYGTLKDEGFFGGKLAGTKPSNGFFSFDIKKRKKNRKWETIITDWSLKHIKDNVEEQWSRTSRRMELIKSDFFIPSEYEEEQFDVDIIEVWFFMDASGSCASYVKRFLDAAHSLPEDKFIVKFHSFDTNVVESQLGVGKVAGFGGTSFAAIEDFIQNKIKKDSLDYPKAVFVITDGWGNRVIPQFPSRWHWLLTDKNNINPIEYFPKECKVYNLKDYE